VEALETSLSTEENAKEISDLKTELEIAGSEVTRLQQALDDVENWKEKLVKESKLYRHVNEHTLCLIC